MFFEALFFTLKTSHKIRKICQNHNLLINKLSEKQKNKFIDLSNCR